MHIWFVSIFENTPVDDNQNTRYNSLVNEARKRGHEITFWASTFKHNTKEQRYDQTTVRDIEDGLSLRFIKSKPYRQNISLKRLLSHRDYGKQLVNEFDRIGSKPNLIMMAFPPVSAAYRVSAWALKNNIPVVLDIIDPWPDVFTSHIKLPNFVTDILFHPFHKQVKKTFKNVTAVTAISNQYIYWAKGYNPGLKQTKCFYPAVQFEQMQKELEMAKKNGKTNDGRFHVIYAGSLGHSYDISTILEAADIIEKEHGTSIQFTIAGDGPQKNNVESYQKTHNNLNYIGRVPKEKLMEYYYHADMGMTQHIKGATQSVTYKLFDLLACGLPILNSLESEMKDIILDNHVGLHNSPGDADQLAVNIIYCFENNKEFEQMKINAIELTKEKGDSIKVYAEAIDFLENISSNKNE